LHQIARVKLFAREIILEEFKPIWSSRTDGQRRKQSHNRALR